MIKNLIKREKGNDEHIYKKMKGGGNPNITYLLTRMSTGRLWEMYSTMMVQKNSGFQWSENFSQPPSAIGNRDLNTQDLISEQKYEIERAALIQSK